MLPEHLTVRGDLLLNGTGVRMLPASLKVEGALHLHGTPITILPDHLTVGGENIIEGTCITEEAVKRVKERGLDPCRNQHPETEMPEAETVSMWRAITGACRDFVKRLSDSIKNKLPSGKSNDHR